MVFLIFDALEQDRFPRANHGAQPEDRQVRACDQMVDLSSLATTLEELSDGFGVVKQVLCEFRIIGEPPANADTAIPPALGAFTGTAVTGRVASGAPARASGGLGSLAATGRLPELLRIGSAVEHESEEQRRGLTSHMRDAAAHEYPALPSRAIRCEKYADAG
jgi:hypothetical protein